MLLAYNVGGAPLVAASPITSCGNEPLRRLLRDCSEEPIIRAALELPYSNGVTEGQVNRLKMIKRTAYGRASFELLRGRVLAAA
jgi:hypothetical protein